MTYIVTGSYATWSGNLGTLRYELEAVDELAAFEAAELRLKADRRRQYMGKLDMSCSPA